MKASLFQKLPNVIPTKEFKQTDAWEQRKLGDVVTIQGGGTPSSLNKKYWDGSINWFTPAEVIDKRYVEYSNKKITESGLQNSSAVLMPKGTILFTSRASIGNMTFLSHPSATNQGFQSLIANSYCCNAEFLYAYGFRIKRFALRNAAGSTFLEISKNELAKCPIKLPGLVEQSRIGEFFKTLDNLIAATERKKELLQKKKQAYLQLIFSQHLRFKGFTKPWRQTQISDIFHERRERNPEGELLSISVANGVQVSTLSNNSMQDLSKYKVVVKNDLAYNSMRMWQGASGASLYNGIVSPAYTVLVPQKDVNSQFYAYLFKTTKMLYIFRSFSQGMTSDTWNLKYPTLSKINVLKPSLIEQNQIAELFKTLDELIKANDKKLELLKKKKKAYLQKMFI